MDPDRSLARILELAERIVNGAPRDLEWGGIVCRAAELAETILSLDEWLRQKSFHPRAWRLEAKGTHDE